VLHFARSRRLLAATAAVLMTLAPVAVLAQEATPEPAAETAPGASPVALTSPEGAWVVAAFDAWQTGLAEPLPDSLLRLTLLAGGTMQGETACGRFDGGWGGTGDELFAGVAPTGFLGCAEAQTAEAIGLSTALDAVVRWQADDAGGLELLDAAGATRVVLEPLVFGDPSGQWLVTRFKRPNGEWAEPLPEQPMELGLLADGILEGGTGCRLLLGGYTFDAGDITIGPFDTEGLPCEGDAQRAERRLLRALGQATTWELNGDALTLSNETEPVLELVRLPELGE
jgi:heat shock protein HslJ